MAMVKQAAPSQCYSYSGSVVDGYGNIVGTLRAETWAVSAAQAKARLEYRYKKEHGYDPKRAFIRLRGVPKPQN